MRSISYIVPYYNSPKTLGKCITSILGQSNWNDEFCEIIIVDNGPDDGFVTNIAHKNNRILTVQESVRGASNARNTGARKARFEFLAFIDCDVVLDSSWCEHIASEYALYAFGFAQGLVIPKAGLKVRYLDQYRKYRLSLNSDNKKHFLLNESRPIINTAACLISKKIFEKVGGFDPRLKKCEDNDLTYRVLNLGESLALVDQSIAFVEYPYQLISYFKRNYEVGKYFVIFQYLWGDDAQLNLKEIMTRILSLPQKFKLLQLILNVFFELGVFSGKKIIKKNQDFKADSIAKDNDLQFSHLRFSVGPKEYKLKPDLNLIIVGKKLVRVINLKTKEFIDLENEICDFIYKVLSYNVAGKEIPINDLDLRIIRILVHLEIL